MSSVHGHHSPNSFEHTFILKATLARLLLIVILMSGFFAYNSMIRQSSPELDIAEANIVTTWENADSKTIEEEVTHPLEKELRTLKGVKNIVSGSFAGRSYIFVGFHTDVNTQDALSQLRTRVTQVEKQLPKEIESPVVSQLSLHDSPIISIRLYGDAGLDQLSQLAKHLQRRLETVSGVNTVTISGALDDIIYIRLIPSQLHALNISPVDIKRTVQQANHNLPWGQFDGRQMSATFRFSGEFRSLEQIRNLPIKKLNTGAVIYLKDVATVKKRLAEQRSYTAFSEYGSDFKRTVAISVTKRAGSDAIRINEQIKQVLNEQKSSSHWLQGVQYSVVHDVSEDISHSLNNVFNSGWQAMLAVFLVLMLSLTWRAAIVAGLAVPVSFAGGLAIISLLGYTLNEVVIIGMVIALGLMVDVFILMMEGMHDNLYVQKKPFSESAVHTLRTFAIPALSGQLTTIIAMIPLLGIAGVTGEFIRPMPVAAIACLVSAYVVAIFLAVPLSRFIFPDKVKHVKTIPIDKLTHKLGTKLQDVLEKRLLVSKKRALMWVTLAASVFAFSFALFSTLPHELMPKRDGKTLGVLIELEENTPLAYTQQCGDAVGEQLKSLDYLINVTQFVGEKNSATLTALSERIGSRSALNYVSFSAQFSPRDSRSKLAYQYREDIRKVIEPALSQCIGSNVYIMPATDDGSVKSPIQIELIGEDMLQLRHHAEAVVDILKTQTIAKNVRHNLGRSVHEIRALPKAEALNFYHVSEQALAEQVRLMMSADKIGEYRTGLHQDNIDIQMGYGWPSQKTGIGAPTYEEMSRMRVITPNTSMPLLSLVDLDMSEETLSVLRRDGNRTVTVIADVYDSTAAEIIQDIKPLLDNMKSNWPAGYRYKFSGEAEDSNQVFGSAEMMLVLALFLVFAVMVIQFNSFIQPLIIMTSIPLALTGVFFGFTLLQLPFSFMGMIGVIALVGIIVNDAIVMIDTMNQHLKNGLTVITAAARGASDRLRPVLTTSITTIVGILPLALSSEMWLPMGITLVSGLLVATVLVLFIIPCLYVLYTRQPSVNHKMPYLSEARDDG